MITWNFLWWLFIIYWILQHEVFSFVLFFCLVGWLWFLVFCFLFFFCGVGLWLACAYASADLSWASAEHSCRLTVVLILMLFLPSELGKYNYFPVYIAETNHQAEVSCAVTYACQWFLTGAVLAFSRQSLRSCPCGCSRKGVFKPWLCLFFY